MPEGHTIARAAREQNKLLAGRTIAVSSPQGRFDVASALVDGQILTSVESYGKHLFYWWSNGMVGHVHLGLFGKFRVHLGAEPPAPVGMVRMRMSSDAATVDLAGPTACSIDTRDERDAIVARLGPDPLRRDARPTVAIDRMLRSKQAMGTLLLDQSVMCGVGNVYRAEALFVHGIHPSRPGRACDRIELEALWSTITAMLKRGVKDNRIVTIDRREFDLPRGRLRRGESTYVYHRDLCLRCGTPIQTVELAGRPCYFCPFHQPV
jgi:endonuclease-8